MNYLLEMIAIALTWVAIIVIHLANYEQRQGLVMRQDAEYRQIRVGAIIYFVIAIITHLVVVII